MLTSARVGCKASAAMHPNSAQRHKLVLRIILFSAVLISKAATLTQD
jgi:hypothetical protein